MAVAACVAVVPISPNGPLATAQTSTPSSRETVPDAVADQMLRLARVTAADVVCDAGGGARIPTLAARTYGARVTTSLAEATVVTLDLSPGANLALETRFRRELRPGTRIVSHRYGIGAWRPDETARAADGTTLFLWTVPRPPARPPDIFFVPTPQAVADQMLSLARVTGDDVVYDLGSGDGRIVILAAQKYGARAVGVELDPALVEISRQVARDGEVADRVRFIEGDLFDANLADATVVTLYLSPTVNRRLASKLKRELRPGARIVSRQFDMGEWTPETSVTAEDGTRLYLWTIRSPR
jgi:Methyltransferase domain